MSNNAKVCPFCGSAIEIAQEFCHNCGANLTESEQQKEFKLDNTGYVPSTSYQPNYSSSYSQSSYQQYPRSNSAYTPPKSSSDSAGIIALIFGILACVGILPCIGSIVAIIVGSSAKNDGSSAGQVGLILGWISCCIPIIAFVIMFLFI